ncbi:MAG: MBL fold metallo-hydrolase [Gammaproteobacteria bacterium]|nr:MBL fold metallo-hydrolase [Gammaproteobacteria bacterium]
MQKLKLILIATFLLMPFKQLQANDRLNLQKVTEDVYAIVGELSNRSPDNLANNATFGFVITAAGVVLIDSGGTFNGAKAIDAIISTVTDKPVVKVINTGGQDHRWLGNGYFSKQGADIIASDAAVSDHKARATDQFIGLANLVGDAEVELTEAVFAENRFRNELTFTLGDTVFEIRHAGAAHTPGDSFVWLPQNSVMFTGDIVYTQRMLGVIEYSDSKSWVNVFKLMASFQPKHIVPGHGQVTNLKRAQQDTLDYLIFLREAVSDFIEGSGEMSDIGKIDQSAFNYLHNFESLAGRNAQQVFTELEWE